MCFVSFLGKSVWGRAGSALETSGSLRIGGLVCSRSTRLVNDVTKTRTGRRLSVYMYTDAE